MTYYSGAETTERESLADTIAVRAPMSVPLISQLPHKTIKNRVHQWSVDRPFSSSDAVRSISSPHSRSQMEGATYSEISNTYPLKLKAICEIQHDLMKMTDTDRTVDAAGMTSTWDYRTGQMATRFMNGLDNTLMYGQGSTETSGMTGVATNPRQCQGLIHWAAWTGLERCHGTKTTIEDPYGVDVTSDYFSVFYDFNHTNITGESFFQNVIRRITNAGGDMTSVPWTFWCGDGLMGRISKFLVTDTGRPINDRNIGASEGGGYDFVNWIVLPNGVRVSFRSNRWLDDMSNTFTIDNTGVTYATPGSPDPEGSISARTFSGDQTLIGYRPGSVQIAWLREPGFEDVASNGDFSQLAIKSEFTLEVAHFLDVAGAGNCSS